MSPMTAPADRLLVTVAFAVDGEPETSLGGPRLNEEAAMEIGGSFGFGIFVFAITMFLKHA